MIERLEKCFRIYFPKKMALLLDNSWRSLHILACIAFAIGCVLVAFNKSLQQSELPFFVLPLMLSAIVYLAPLGIAFLFPLFLFELLYLALLRVVDFFKRRKWRSE
jgi:hypothetical protein